MIKTLPFSAKKKCIIKMGARPVAVNSACLCPYTKTLRVVTVRDIVKCLSAGATVLEFTRDSKDFADIKTLDIKNAAYVFDEEHLEYLRKFNTDIRTPVMQRDSYLIDTPEAPKKTEIPETPVVAPEVTEEVKVEESTVQEPVAEEQVIETVVEEPKEEVKVEEAVEVTEEVANEANAEEEAPAEEPTESEDESTEEEQPKYYNNNRKNRNRR